MQPVVEVYFNYRLHYYLRIMLTIISCCQDRTDSDMDFYSVAVDTDSDRSSDKDYDPLTDSAEGKAP